MKLSKYIVGVDGLVDRFAQDCRIVFSTRTSTSLIVREDIWGALQAGAIELLSAEDVTALVDAEVLIPDHENELEFVLAQNNAAKMDHETLYLVLQPTRSCQLGCGYCGQRHSTKRMTTDTATRALNHAKEKLSTGRYRSLLVCWFGAEPLLGLQEIRTLTAELKNISAAHNVEYQAKIVTNGLALSSTVATELVLELGVRHIELTLDGLSETHDQRRPLKSGRPTFAKIYDNLKRACDLDLPVELSLRCNTDGRNANSALALIEKMTDDGLAGRVRFYVAPVHSWGNDAHEKALASSDFASFELVVLDSLARNGFAVSYLPGRRPIVCMAVQHDAALFDAEGDQYNCTEVSYVPSYGSPNLYRIGRGPRESSQPAMVLKEFDTHVRRGMYACTSCRMLPVCGGGCPKQWSEGIEPCPPTKRNIEGRLLRAHPSLSPRENWDRFE